MATASDMYRNCKAMVLSSVAPEDSAEKQELIRNQAIASAKLKTEQEEMEILLASKKSQTDVITTWTIMLTSAQSAKTTLIFYD